MGSRFSPEPEMRRQVHTETLEEDNERPITRLPALDDAHPAVIPVSRQRQLSILLCAFFDVFVTIGVGFAYGVFLTYYLDTNKSEQDQFLPPEQMKNKALVAFIGTLGSGLTWGGSIFVNPMMARMKDPRWITLTGAALLGLGYVLASFVHNVGWPSLSRSSSVREVHA